MTEKKNLALRTERGNEEKGETKKAQREEVSVPYTRSANCARCIDEDYGEE